MTFEVENLFYCGFGWRTRTDIQVQKFTDFHETNTKEVQNSAAAIRMMKNLNGFRA